MTAWSCAAQVDQIRAIRIAGRLTVLLHCLYNASLDLEFDWDTGNIEHIAGHDLKPEEVEQVFSNEPMIVAMEHEGEQRALCFGRTNSGRFLTVIYTERKEKIRVVTAYRMTRAQQRLYLTGRSNG